MKNTVILHIPHASTVIPADCIDSFDRNKLPHEIDMMTDWFCDELFDGGEKIVFPVSRPVCDVERFRSDEDEIMAKVGMDAVYRCASDRTHLRTVTAQQRETILRRYYDAHHARLTQAVRRRLDGAGNAGSRTAIRFTRPRCRMSSTRTPTARISASASARIIHHRRYRNGSCASLHSRDTAYESMSRLPERWSRWRFMKRING